MGSVVFKAYLLETGSHQLNKLMGGRKATLLFEVFIFSYYCNCLVQFDGIGNESNPSLNIDPIAHAAPSIKTFSSRHWFPSLSIFFAVSAFSNAIPFTTFIINDNFFICLIINPTSISDLLSKKDPDRKQRHIRDPIATLKVSCKQNLRKQLKKIKTKKSKKKKKKTSPS